MSIRAEVQAQFKDADTGRRWADFVLQQGEFAGHRESYEPKGRRELSPEPVRPPRRSIEMVMAQANELRAQGVGVGAAAARIGFCDAFSMRRYMRMQGQECPWPASPDWRFCRVPDDVVEAARDLHQQGLTWPQVGERLGYNHETLRVRVKKLTAGT